MIHDLKSKTDVVKCNCKMSGVQEWDTKLYVLVLNKLSMSGHMVVHFLYIWTQYFLVNNFHSDFVKLHNKSHPLTSCLSSEGSNRLSYPKTS